MNKKLLIIAGIVVGVAVVVMIVVFLYINRGGFIQAHVLPVVEKKIGESVTAEEIEFSIFNGIEFKNFQIGAGEPIAKAKTIRVAYAFVPLLKGNVEVEEILVDQLDVKLTDKKLEEILNNLGPPETEEAKPAVKEPAKVGAMPGVFVKSLKVNQLNFEFKQLGNSDADIVTAVIHDLNLDLSDFGSDSNFSLNVKTRAGYAIEGDKIDVGDIIVIAKGKLGKNLLPAQLDLEAVVDRAKGSAAGIAVDMESMRYKARIDLGANASFFALDGEFALNQLGVESTIDKDLEPILVSVAAGHKFSVDLDKRVFDLDKFEAMVDSNQTQLFSMKLSNPTEINLADPGGADAAIAMKVNLDNRFAGPLIPKIDDVRIRDWAFRSEDLSLSVKNGKDIQLKGLVVIDRIDITAMGTDYAGLVFRDEFEVECRGMQMISEGGKDVLAGDVTFVDKLIVAERGSNLVDVNVIGDLQLNSGNGKFDLRVEPTDLSNLAHLLPPLVGIEKLEGKVWADINAGFMKLGEVVNVGMKASLTDMDVAIKDKGHLVRPVSIGVDSALSYTADGMLGVNSTLVNVTGKNREHLAEIKISGSMDVMMKARKSELLISSDKTIEGELLAGFWVATPTGDTGTADKPASIAAEISHQAAPATLPPLWIDTKLDFADIKYKDLRVKDLMANVTLKDNQLALKETNLKINQGAVKIDADCDLKDLNKPGYKTKINIKDLAFDPFMTSFVGLVEKMPMRFSGGFKNADINVQGSGYEMEDLQKNLFADAKVKFSSFRVKEFTGLYGKTMPMLMNVFKLRMDDLAFDAGDAQIEITDGKIKLAPSKLSSAKLDLNYQGEVELGGNWRQDLKLQGTLSPDLAERVPEYVQLVQLDNGMSQTNVIPLKGDLTKPGTIVGIIGSACVKPEYREEAELIAALASGEKPKAKDVLEKGLKLGIKKYFEKEDAKDDEKGNEKNSDKDKVKDLLKSLF